MGRMPAVRVARRAPIAIAILALSPGLPGQAAGAPLAPEQSAREAVLEPGLAMELVASEPLIESPVAIAFDEKETLWVVEMRDYPEGPPPGSPPRGRVTALRDRDGDGVYEEGSVFATGLLFANGVLPWRGGIIVTAAPSILWLADTDGDGKADLRRVLLEGFSTDNSQLLVSDPTLSLDGWIYVTNGLRGGDVSRPGAAVPGAGPLRLGGMDLRFDPDRGAFEAVSGGGQFGLAFDDWGRRFVCDNRHHIRHVVFPERYARGNPYLAVPGSVEDTSTLEAGFHYAGSPIRPLSRTWTNFSSHEGRFTAACGIHVHGGDLLPPRYRGAVFTCEPTANLVHAEILEPSGATFRSRPAREDAEFLASRDPWFRPVNLADGPGGALYVCDMYRAVVEHPAWMPADLARRIDYREGADRGRIWRVVPVGGRRERRPFDPTPSPEALARELESAESWRRGTAHRLLLELGSGAAPALREIASKTLRPVARLHAAHLLDAVGSLEEAHALSLLSDEHPRLRDRGAALCEPWVSGSAAVRESLLRLAGDPDPAVRFQAALSLGGVEGGDAIESLAAIAVSGASDRWTRLAAAAGAARRSGALIEAVVSRIGASGIAPPREIHDLVRELAQIGGARGDSGELETILRRIQGSRSGPAQRAVALSTVLGVAQGMARRGEKLGSFVDAAGITRAGPREALLAILAKAGEEALDPSTALERRLDAIELLGHASGAEGLRTLGSLLADDPREEVRSGSARALGARPEPEASRLLLEGWSSQGPRVRRAVLDALIRDSARAAIVLDAIEAGRIAATEIPPDARRSIVERALPDHRERARAALDLAPPAEREAVLARYRAALPGVGKLDRPRAREVFEKHCAACHRVDGIGADVGPAIADIQVKGPEAILEDILDPSRAIDQNYAAYTVLLRGGGAPTGLIASESASSVTLRRAGGETETLLRIDIEEIRSSGLSLMPDGLEKAIEPGDMAELIRWLRERRLPE